MASFGGFRAAVLVCFFRQLSYCRMGLPGITVVRRMTLRVKVFLDFACCLILKFGSAPDPFGCRGFLRWPLAARFAANVQNDGFQGRHHSGGTPGRHPHVCLLSPSGQRAEHEVARSWTERSRPIGHRPTGFVKVPLTQWLGAGTKLRRWHAWGLTEGTSGEAGGARRPAQTRTGTPRAGRDGSLRRERESPTEQTRFC